MNDSLLKDKKIGILMGGLSRERDISMRSGENCLAALQKLGYNAVGIDVGRDVGEVLGRQGIEIAFLALHGKYGEDGSIQGLLEVQGIPYTGSGVMASALAMNKVLSKQLAVFHEVPTPDFIVTGCDRDSRAVCDSAIEKMEFPFMVKPCEEGSSFGVTKVDDSEGLSRAVDINCRDYEAVMVEEYIDGDEITVGLLETESDLLALPVLQLVPKSDFYDYEAKYTEGETEFILPADIPPETAKLSQELAKKVHNALGCRGFSRVDFMVDRQGVPQFTEINTLPGMTDTSDLPAQARQAGYSYERLVEIMLETALL